jgi:hypothetical protein
VKTRVNCRFGQVDLSGPTPPPVGLRRGDHAVPVKDLGRGVVDPD